METRASDRVQHPDQTMEPPVRCFVCGFWFPRLLAQVTFWIKALETCRADRIVDGSGALTASVLSRQQERGRRRSGRIWSGVRIKRMWCLRQSTGRERRSVEAVQFLWPVYREGT